MGSAPGLGVVGFSQEGLSSRLENVKEGKWEKGRKEKGRKLFHLVCDANRAGSFFF